MGIRLKVDEFRVGLSYNDVLLIPRRSGVESRRSVDTSTKLTKNITLGMPLILRARTNQVSNRPAANK